MIELLKKIKKGTFGKIFPSGEERIDLFLIKELKGCSSVIDLGCGGTPSLLSRFSRIKKKYPHLYSVGIDIFEEYIVAAQKTNVHSRYIKSDILKIDFPENSFDCALLIDVIEHIKKDDFYLFLPKLEKIAKKIIILTPNGFIDNDIIDNNEHQAHQSGWSKEEMKSLGFDCFGVSGLKFLRKKSCLPKIKPAIFGNLISDMTEPLVYNKPEKAWHLICVKVNNLN